MSNKLPGFALRTAMAGVLASLGLVGMADRALALDHPSALALDAAGNLYIAESGDFEQGRAGDVSIYSVKVKSTGVTATLMGTITSNIKSPSAVAVSPFGTIYAGNLANDTITVYAPLVSATTTPSLSQTGTISDPSIVSYPVNMFVDGDGDLFVLDNGSNVHLYLDNLSAAGTLRVGGTAVAMNPWGSNLAVWGNFPASGIGITTFTGNMGEAVHGGAVSPDYFVNGSLLPTGVAEDSRHNQYATNSSLATITVYDPNFYKMGSFAGYGSAIAIDSVRKLIYTTVPSSGLVFIYSLKPPYKYLGQF